MFTNISQMLTTDDNNDSAIYCLVSTSTERLPISHVKFVNVAADVWLNELDEYIKY